MAGRPDRADRRRARSGSSATRGRRSSGRPGRAPGCTGAAGRRTPRELRPSSTIRPAYITASRSQAYVSTDRSWVMNSSARPVVALELGEQGRAPAPAPSRRARSSARRRSGAWARRPAPARSAHVGAARPTAGADSRGRAGPGCRPVRAARRPVPWRASVAVVECSRIASSIWSPTRCTGLSECSAPWNTIAALVQRTARRRPGFIA